MEINVSYIFLAFFSLLIKITPIITKKWRNKGVGKIRLHKRVTGHSKMVYVKHMEGVNSMINHIENGHFYASHVCSSEFLIWYDVKI